MAGGKKREKPGLFFSPSEGGSDRIMVLVYVDEKANYPIFKGVAAEGELGRDRE